jgi:AmiR/NasT family two-component response regulator
MSIFAAQAKGALAPHLGLGVDEAFEALRAHARRTQTRLGVVATAVLTDPTEMNRLTGSYPS